MNTLLKKHRFKIYAGVIFSAIFAISFALLKDSFSSSPFRGTIADNSYTITLTSSNGGNSFSSSYSSSTQTNTTARTNKGNQIDFVYSNVKKSSGLYAQVKASGGYLYNSTQITGIEDITVNYTGGTLSLITSKSTTFSGSGQSITSGSCLSVSPNNDFIKLVNNSGSDASISSIVINYSCAPRPEIIKDVIVQSDTWTGSSYGSFTCTKTGATYKGESCKNGTNGFQFKVNGSSTGIVSTTSGGTISSVKITVLSGSNEIQVYGSNTAYTAASDLFGSNKGTLVGTATANKTIAFTEPYSYVGIRSGSGTVYLEQLEITWGTPSVPPTPATLPAGTYTASLSWCNPIPSTINILNGDSQAVAQMAISENGIDYKDDYFCYYLVKNAYILFTNTTNAVITDITITYYKYNNFALYLDESAIFTGTGTQVSNNEVKTFSGLSGKDTVKVLCNGGGSSYSQQVYSVSLTLFVEGDVNVTGVSLDKTQMTIPQESSGDLTATVLPANATNKNVTWSSSNPSVASVDQNGHVTTGAAGTATITVETEDGRFTASCTVTVTAVYHVTSVSLNKASTSIVVGSNETLTATVLPTNATNKNVTWSSSNTSVATVSNGTVTAVAKGTATITVTTVDQNKSATCTVTVTEIAVSSVTLNKSSTSIVRGSTETLTATVLPANASNKNINWSSSNTGVATVSNGTVTGVATGTATITAESASNSSIKATCTVTITPKSVVSISLNKSQLALNAGQQDTLTVTFNPTDADDKVITWTSSNANVATVSNGTVTAVAEGSATITATSHDGGKQATCSVTVTEAPAETTYTFNTASWGATPANWTCGQKGNQYSSGRGVQVTTGASGANATSPESFSGVSEVVVTYCTNANDGAGSATITVGGTTLDSSKTLSKTGGTTLRDVTFSGDGSLSGAVKITVTCTQNSIYIYSVTIRTANIAATNVSLPSSIDVGIGSHAKINPTYSPSGANKNTALTWEKRSGSSTITVDQDGIVYASEQATTSHTAVIRATLKSDTTKYSECTVHVTEVQKAKHTILLYLCGSTLEYDTDYNEMVGAASDDISEILSVNGQSGSDVNIVIETGGTTQWNNYNIASNKLTVYHVENKSLVKDSTPINNSNANMGESSTLQAFLEYGLTNYPAEKTGVILWDHGGAMTGVCNDDNYSMDSLTAAEVKSAVSGAKQATGHTEKLEWIGYDACLMAVADIASVNSEYFNYMVASEETEPGDGWDYQSWIPTLYSSPSNTRTVLNQIASSYKTFYNKYNNTKDATLAVYDLSYMSKFTTAFENFASKLSSSDWENLVDAYNSSLRFGVVTEDNVDHYLYGIADMKDFLTKVSSRISKVSSYVTSVLSALDNLVIYNYYCSYYTSSTGYPCGICAFFAYGSSLYYPYTKQSQYTTNDTNFTTWRSYLLSNGEWSTN